MTLAGRMTLFSLVGLAAVLAGFSLAVHSLAGEHLHHRAEDRLSAAVNVLAAAAEVKSNGIEWEPAERRLVFGAGGESVVWQIADPAGGIVDRSSSADEDFLKSAAEILRTHDRKQKKLDAASGRWLVHQILVEPDRRSTEKADPKAILRPYLVITAGTSLEADRVVLRELATRLATISGLIWLAALVAGRFICRWALRPVSAMAAAARTMDASELGDRLPLPATRDELADVGRAFNGLLDRVQEAFERQRRFTAEASHQLRTPLAALLGQVDVALRRRRPAEEHEQTLTSVKGQAERLNRIVEALLFLARADADARAPEREPVDFGLWVREHLQTNWGSNPRFADMTISGGCSGLAAIHPVLMGELLKLLIENACKYSDPGSPIAVGLASAAGMAMLTIADRGCGVSADDLQHLFEPFHRGEEARRRGVGGLGLGLATAKRIAQIHGGRLTAASELGKGFTVRLMLPMAEPGNATFNVACSSQAP